MRESVTRIPEKTSFKCATRCAFEGTLLNNAVLSAYYGDFRQPLVPVRSLVEVRLMSSPNTAIGIF
jgi:hypothetical protein